MLIVLYIDGEYIRSLMTVEINRHEKHNILPATKAEVVFKCKYAPKKKLSAVKQDVTEADQ